MEQSPLAQQPRPEVFQPKIVHLYGELLADSAAELDADGHPRTLSEGFWAEFFLLRPDRRALRQRIDALSVADLLLLEAQTRQLFARAVAVLVAGAAAGGAGAGGGARAATATAAAAAAAAAAAGAAPPTRTSRVNGHRLNGSVAGGAGAPAATTTVRPSLSPASSTVSSSSLARPAPPSASPAAVEHALATLTTFLSAVLAKKYTNPSSDAIALLAGLDRVDAVLTDFVGALDHLLRHGRTAAVRAGAVDAALAMTAGAYQTTLLTYFIQRDLFGSIMRVILDDPAGAARPFTLVGLLANYNKFEFQNPYQLRLTDFVNEQAIQRILWSVGAACRQLRGQYLAIQDDLPVGWTLASTLGLLGLGSGGGGGGGGGSAGKSSNDSPAGAGGAASVYDAETAKKMFAALPGSAAAVLLATYDFTHANKLFCLNLVTLGPQPPAPASADSAAAASSETPFASFVSLTSYLLQNAYRSPRATAYTHLALMVFRLLIEDAALCKRLCSAADDATTPVRLCRQRPPHLPLVKQARPLAASLLDAMVDGVTHNLRRRLDVGLYTLCVGILLRLVAHLSRTHTRLAYPHWPELFRALLGLVRFLTTYAADLGVAVVSSSSSSNKNTANGNGNGSSNGNGGSTPAPAPAPAPAPTKPPALPHELATLLDHVVNLIALGLSAGEAFLPTPAAYDDLFYKVVEAGDLLERFRDTYGLAARPTNGIDTLLRVNAHYKQMLHGADGSKTAGRTGSRLKGGGLTSLQVAEVIRQGYETLSIQATEGLDSWEKYREADERMELKKAARTAVADVKRAVEAEER